MIFETTVQINLPEKKFEDVAITGGQKLKSLAIFRILFFKKVFKWSSDLRWSTN